MALNGTNNSFNNYKKNNGAVKLLQSKFGITLILIRKYMNQKNRFIVLKCIVFKV